MTNYNLGMKRKRKRLFLNYRLLDLITPFNLPIFWRFGFVLGIILVIQIVTGVFLSFHFQERVEYIIRELSFGESIRLIHSNGVSLFFFCLFMHIFRGIFYKSYIIISVWATGIFIFFFLIITSFLGYVLPWTQIRFWAATVITNLVSAIPVIGLKILTILWGDFSVRIVTLNRFFSLHYLLPFILLLIVIIHILVLHLSHSSSPIVKGEGIKFHPLFSWKDVLLGLLLFFFLMLFSFFFPYIFLEYDIFFPANPLVTPEHIVPEWYFLPFYAILRAVPSKLGGVVLMVRVFIFLLFLPFGKEKGKLFSALLLIEWCLLFWIGGLPVIFPYDIAGQIIVLRFFIRFILCG